MPRTAAQQQLLDDYGLIENLQERLSAVVDRAELRDSRCHFRCDADGPLVKGLVAFLCAYSEGTTPAELLADDTDPIAELGLLDNLSPTRRNGLAAVRTALRAFAQSQM